jgi:Fur family ferric uptake transcriptional regulator
VERVPGPDPHVSVATVYRTMKLLAESGLAVARRFDDGQTRYEPSGHGDHHDHLICNACGRIVEFENARIEELQLRVARNHGFEVESHKLELYGRCDRCRGASGARETGR